MEPLTDNSAVSPKDSNEAVIAAEQIARGRGGSQWLAGFLAGIGVSGLLLAAVALWIFLPASQTADIAIYRQQKAILAEAEAAMGDPVAMEAVASRHNDEMVVMATDLTKRLSSSYPHRKFLSWNAKYRFAEITGSDPQKSAQGVKDFEANLKQAATYLRLKD